MELLGEFVEEKLKFAKNCRGSKVTDYRNYFASKNRITRNLIFVEKNNGGGCFPEIRKFAGVVLLSQNLV